MAALAAAANNVAHYPIYGQPYVWDPASRQLSMPAGKEFDAIKIKSITVPKL